MIIGYARVSTESQNLDRQIDALNNYQFNGNGVERIFKEKITGTKTDRPEFEKVMSMLRVGDILVIESLSRLGRSSKDLLTIIENLNNLNVKLISLKENIDTETPTGKLLLTILSALCQFERDLIVQRTKEGLQSARARGRKGGRPKTDAKTVEQAIKLYQAQTYSIKEITRITGISQGTLYTALKQIKV